MIVKRRHQYGAKSHPPISGLPQDVGTGDADNALRIVGFAAQQ
jgi:hypothetical protein